MSKPTGEGKLIPDRLVALRYDVHVRRTLERGGRQLRARISRADLHPPPPLSRRSRSSIGGTNPTPARLRTPTTRIGTARRARPGPAAWAFHQTSRH